MDLISEMIDRVMSASQFLVGVGIGFCLGWLTSMATAMHRRERAQMAASRAAAERDTAAQKKASAEAAEATARSSVLRAKAAAAEDQAREWRAKLEQSLRG